MSKFLSMSGLQTVSSYFNYSSLFAQNGNKSLSAFQAVSASYANGTFQLRRVSAVTLDILDLSPAGLAKANEIADSQSTEPIQETSDVTLATEKPKISETDRVEMIRVNKNAVLERVKEVLDDKGVSVPEDQRFELTTNFLDGSISVEGINDPELAAAVNEALAGDEELIARMKKTREELGLDEPPNTIPRNFTIEFGSMVETPPNAELEFQIDIFVNQPIPISSEETEAGATDEEKTVAASAAPMLWLSVLLSNKMKTEPVTELLDLIEENKVPDKKKEDESESAFDTVETIEEEELVSEGTERTTSLE
jgi:hypothetical protein